MSMLSDQIKELRDRAKVLRQGDWSDGANDALLMEDAADTIESMRDRLHATIETCELKGRSDTCSKCGASVERVTHSIFEMGDGFACCPNFCPNCGAKVTHD